MRDLQGSPESDWDPIRRTVPVKGWGAKVLCAIDADGLWPEEGWKGSIWSLGMLIDFGVPPEEPRARFAADKYLQPKLSASRFWETVGLFKRTDLFKYTDLCHLGFWQRIGSYFGLDQEHLVRLAEIVLELQMPDGGWNYRSQRLPKTRHSSFHTTFDILEGLKDATDSGILPVQAFRQSEARALEFMLAHHLYRSDRTGEIFSESFTRLSHPSRWHYRVLRGLNYFRNCPDIADVRLADPVALLAGRCKPNGRWPCEFPITCKSLFQMEPNGGDSRWNTLKAMCVLAARSRSMNY